jgi:hypothetical protein
MSLCPPPRGAGTRRRPARREAVSLVRQAPCTQATGPTRTCVGCRSRSQQAELLRLAATPTGCGSTRGGVRPGVARTSVPTPDASTPRHDAAQPPSSAPCAARPRWRSTRRSTRCEPRSCSTTRCREHREERERVSNKVRVYELAKETGLHNKEVLRRLEARRRGEEPLVVGLRGNDAGASASRSARARRSARQRRRPSAKREQEELERYRSMSGRRSAGEEEGGEGAAPSSAEQQQEEQPSGRRGPRLR